LHEVARPLRDTSIEKCSKFLLTTYYGDKAVGRLPTEKLGAYDAFEFMYPSGKKGAL